MLINKTADECIIETGGALFQCFVDKNLTVDQKKICINWIILFLNYQDSIIFQDKNKIKNLKKELSQTFTTSYYNKALQEFDNANTIYNEKTNLADFNNICLMTSSQEVITIIINFNETFNGTFNKHQSSLNYFDLTTISKDLLLLFFIVHYHLGWWFKQELLPIVKTFTKIVKTPIYIEQNESHVKMLLMKKILVDNKEFFDNIEPIHLRNFIHSLDDIFSDGLNISSKIEKLVFNKPHRIKYSMNMLLKKHGVNLKEVLWNNDEEANPIIINMIMHLFAYETYYVQRNNNYETYEQLILNTVLIDPLYQQIFADYKKSNNINKVT